MQNRKINVGITGHRGVIGSEFIKRNKKFNFLSFKGDITKKQSVEKWISKNNFKILLHFAAIATVSEVEKNFRNAKKVNYHGTKNLVDAIVKHKPNNLIWFFYASTSHVYKSSNKLIKEDDKKVPINLYGSTKLMAEKYILKKKKYSKVRFCIGRVFSFTHYKQNDSYFIPAVYKKIYIKKKRKIFLSGLNQYRDFIGPKDICDAINFLCKKKPAGIYNIASGKKHKLFKIVKILLGNKKVKITTDKKGDKNLAANISKIKKLGWKPKQNIKKILKWYIKNKKV